MKELNKKILGGFKWTVFRSGGEEFIHLLVFIFLARLLTPEDFGIIALAMIFIGFLDLITDQGFGSAIVQRKNIEKSHLDSSFWVNLSIGFFFLISIFIAAGPISSFFDQAILKPILQILSISFVIKALSIIPMSVLTKDLAFKHLAIRGILAALVAGVIGIWFAWQGFGVYSLVAYKLALSITSVLTVWWLIEWRPSLTFSLKHVKELWGFGFNVTLFKITSQLETKAFNTIVGYYLGAIALGNFTVAKKLANHARTLLNKTVSRVLFPVFSVKQDDKRGIEKSLLDVNKLMMGVIMPTLVFLAYNSELIVRLIFGEQWGNAASLFAIFTIWIFLRIQVSLFKQTLLSIGEASFISIVSLVGLFTSVVFVFVVIDGSWETIALAYIASQGIIVPIILRKAVIENITKTHNYLMSFIPGLLNTAILTATGFVLIHIVNLTMFDFRIISSTIALLITLLIYVTINWRVILKIFKHV